jgi:hypothetical protein
MLYRPVRRKLEAICAPHAARTVVERVARSKVVGISGL